MDKSIHVIITGGTIDSHYDGSKDTAVPNKESVIPSFLESVKMYDTEFEFTVACMKDSRDLSDEDRKKILKTVEESKHSKILITHGTYTMPDTSRYLKANLKRTDQAIIFTASMIPIQGFSPSDGPFSLGYAIAKLQDMENGIFVCVNGHVFVPEEVEKDLAEGRFTSTFRGTPGN